jgi:flagellin-like hook-associated protein FlgL
MINILERLRNTTTQSIGFLGVNEISVSDLQLAAADEIERLRKEIECAAYAAEVGGLNSLADRLRKALA